MSLIKNRILPLFMIMALALSVSCTKSSEEAAKPSLPGSLWATAPAYAKINGMIHVECGGISEDVEGLEYGMVSSTLFKDTLWTNSADISTPKETGQHIILIIARADGYYMSSMNKFVELINPEPDKSLQGLKHSSTTFTDDRDGEVYEYVHIGNLDWFAQNLNYAGAGSGYSKCDDIGLLFGRLYTWNDATGGVSGTGLGAGPQGVCPDGWHIPTNEDWEDLAQAVGVTDNAFSSNWLDYASKLMVRATFNGEDMWVYTGNFDHTNDFGWNALSTGFATNNYGQYVGLKEIGTWWSSTEYSADEAQYKYINAAINSMPVAKTQKTDFAAAIRCVRK